MTKEELRRYRLAAPNIEREGGAGFSQPEAARLLGVSTNTLARYERGELPIPKPFGKLARILYLNPDADPDS